MYYVSRCNGRYCVLYHIIYCDVENGWLITLALTFSGAEGCDWAAFRGVQID